MVLIFLKTLISTEKGGMNMKHKNIRHAKIIEIIKAHDIETQDDLTNKLQLSDFNVTQATVSRDIKELHLVKILMKNNKYKYSQSINPTNTEVGSLKFKNIMKESVVSIKIAQNIVIIKCYSGMAQSACATIDLINKADIVGTIAGDDTIFIATEDNQKACALMLEFNNIIAED